MEGTHIDNQIDQRIEIGDGPTIADLGTLDAQCFGLAVDALAGRALRVNGVIQGTIAV